MKQRIKDVLVRAFKTFWQSALSYLILSLTGFNFGTDTLSKRVIIGLILSAGAAGLSAAYNGVIGPFLADDTEEEEPDWEGDEEK